MNCEQLEEEEKAYKQIQCYLLWGSLSVVVNIAMFYLLTVSLALNIKFLTYLWP